MLLDKQIKFTSNKVRIEKVGWIELSEKGVIPVYDKYTNPRITFDGKYWYVSVGLEQDNQIEELTDEIIGIDVGIKELVVCSNGLKFKNINKTKTVKKLEKRLRRLQRQVSHKYQMNKEGSRFVKTSNIIKLEKKIRMIQRRLNGIRSNHIHQATNAIVKTKPCRIVVESLNVKGLMKNKHLSKTIAQQKLHDFKTKLKYKTDRYGIEFTEADKWFPSSKMCSCCGEINKDLKLSNRIFTCSCGFVIDRDENASLNLSRYEKQVVAQSP